MKICTEVVFAASLVAAPALAAVAACNSVTIKEAGAIDTDKDGVLSKQEYIKGHEALNPHQSHWDRLQKNRDNQVDLNVMETIYRGSTGNNTPQPEKYSKGQRDSTYGAMHDSMGTINDGIRDPAGTMNDSRVDPTQKNAQDNIPHPAETMDNSMSNPSGTAPTSTER